MVSVKTGFLNVKTVKLICQVTPPNSWIDNSYHNMMVKPTNQVQLILSHSDCLDEVEEDNNEEEINEEEIGGEEQKMMMIMMVKMRPKMKRRLRKKKMGMWRKKMTHKIKLMRTCPLMNQVS